MHLGCPVRFVEAAAALHLPVPRRRLRLPRQGRRRSAGPPARPLLHRDAQRHSVEIGPRFSVNSELAALLAARPGRAARRHRPVPLPVAAHGPQARRGPSHAQASSSHRCRPPLRPRPKRPGEGNGKVKPLDARSRGGHQRRRLDRRAHVAVGRRALADVPQGPQGDQLVLHAGLGDDVRLPQPGGHRRLPGDVLRPVAHAARTSRCATSPTRPSSASSCTGCTSGARR